MQIIIPMTGYGSRFVAAGYQELKPFIRVMGKPVIQWIVEGIFPKEENIIFVCRKEHLDANVHMRDELLAICPTAVIYAVDQWVKKGPVYDVLRAGECIDDDNPTIINYCDFYMQWDWEQFKEEVAQRGCDGCIPCYTGFHPHLLPDKNVYASCLTDAEDNLVEIREKYSFKADKTRAKHSPGTYYFKTGRLLKKYCQALVDTQCTLNGEYYASLPYNGMVKDGLKVWIPTNVSYFCQWGTPEDMREFEYWTNLIMEGDEKKDENRDTDGWCGEPFCTKGIQSP